jgi:hypothetical protein
MKPLDPVAPGAVAQAKPELVDETQAALSQRLWQLLCVLPDIQLGGLSELSCVQTSEGLAGAASGDATLDNTREREQREPDVMSALASAAHILATTVQQLGIARYDATREHSGSEAAGTNQPWTMRLIDVDASGGSASVSVLHPLLGDIELDVEIDNGSARVVASVANDHGARILQEGQAVLAERLLRQGITLQLLEVTVRRKRKSRDSQPRRKRTGKEER